MDGDETVIEFTTNALEDVTSKIPREKRGRVLDKLIEVTESPNPRRYVDYFEGHRKLGKIYIDGEIRTICCIVTHLPGYELLPVFAITEHDYSTLQKHDKKAVSAVERLSDLETRADVEEYVENRPNTFQSEEIRELRDKLRDT